MLVHSSDLKPEEQDVPLAATFIASINWFRMPSFHDNETALSLPSFVNYFTLVSIVYDSYTQAGDEIVIRRLARIYQHYKMGREAHF